LDEYLFFHYGKPDQLCPFPFVSRDLLRFHERLRKECLFPTDSSGRARSPLRAASPAKHAALDKGTARRGLRALPQETIRALDIGCAVGRFTFELTRVADEVSGIDNSHSFVAAARSLARKGSATVRVHESGDQFSTRKIALSKSFQSGKARFEVGDAMKLGASLHNSDRYQIIAAINLLCRLPSPRRFLRQLPDLVATGGQLLLASPFSWLGSFTPRSEWLTPEAVTKLLRPRFRLARERDLPFLIREHRRKYQLVISHVMTFVRKSN